MFNIHDSCDILEALLDYLSWTNFMDNEELEQYDKALAAIRNYIKANEGECHD